MEKSSLEVNILGSSFTVQSNGELQHLRHVIDYLESKVAEIRQKYAENTTQDPVKISLLAGLNVVDELFHRQRTGNGDSESSELERITERIIDTIDKSLTEN